MIILVNMVKLPKLLLTKRHIIPHKELVQISVSILHMPKKKMQQKQLLL